MFFHLTSKNATGTLTTPTMIVTKTRLQSQIHLKLRGPLKQRKGDVFFRIQTLRLSKNQTRLRGVKSQLMNAVQVTTFCKGHRIVIKRGGQPRLPRKTSTKNLRVLI